MPRASILRVLKYVIAPAVLAFVIWRAEPGDVWRVLKHADAGYVALAALINLPAALAMTLRSLLILRRLGHRHIPLSIVAPVSILGNIAGAVTPAASGEVLRAVALRSKAGVPVADSVALVLYERVGSIYLLALSTGAFAALAGLPVVVGIVITLVTVAAIVLPWAFAIVILPHLPLAASVAGESLRQRAWRYFLSTAAQLRFLLADLGLLLATSALTLVIFALAALQFQLLTRAVHASQPLDEAWVAFGVSQLAGMLSLLPFGLGVSDGSLAAVLHRAGATLEQGTAVAVLVRGAITLPLSLLALGCYIYLERQQALVVPDATPVEP